MTTESDQLIATNAEDQEEHARRWVEAFADGWRAPASGDAFIEHFKPWLAASYRFNQPISLREGVGPMAFRDRFARPFFSVLRDVRGSVESWARTGDTLFIALRLEGTIGRRRVTMHACDRVRLVDGKAVERFAYADPMPILLAAMFTPRLWPRAVRWQLDEARAARRWS